MSNTKLGLSEHNNELIAQLRSLADALENNRAGIERVYFDFESANTLSKTYDMKKFWEEVGGWGEYSIKCTEFKPTYKRVEPQ